MDLIEKLEERLSVFKNLYDDIRIVDPVKKNLILTKLNKNEEANNSCFAIWNKNSFCENCISMRAYINNDTFVKFEYARDKVFLITAAPIDIEGDIYIVELLKDITKNGNIVPNYNREYCYEEDCICFMNKKVVIDKLTGIYSRKYIDERLPVDLNYCRIYDCPLSLIMVELEFPEDISNKCGRIEKDKVIKDFSNLASKSIRDNSDWIGRYEKDKFVIVLKGTELQKAHISADKIKREIENTNFIFGEMSINITLNTGVYEVTDIDVNAFEVVAKVEKNLHKVKLEGNNEIRMIREKIDDGGFMNSSREIKLERLDKQITELREVLNEITCTVDEGENKHRKLAVSQYLDELIVEYMKVMMN